MPELVIRAPPVYLDATPPPLNLSSFAANATCTGQTIVKSTLDPNANCNTISQAFNAATGDVQAATGSPNCTITHSSFCLQEPCALEQVPSNASCDSLAASFSTANLTVSTVQLLTWNPNINGLCDGLTPGDYVCAGAPGGSYILPTPPPGNSSDAGQQRGGEDGTSSAPTASSFCAGGTAPPEQTQAGIASNCDKWVEQTDGVYCADMASAAGITLA
jgi:hypothetical protein